MTKKIDFDLQEAHRYFSVECFNHAWDLMDQPARTVEEGEEMIRLSLASLWHWTQRLDCTPTNLSVGYWQASRIHAMLGQADSALDYAQRCMEVSQGEDVLPFFLAYAYEALARAEMLVGDDGQSTAYLNEARRISEGIADEESRKQVLSDLDTI